MRPLAPRVNDPCPCLSGRKFKHCCRGVVDWRAVSSKAETLFHLSPRGRNLLFAERLGSILKLDSLTEKSFRRDYKAAFTASAVRSIHEAVLEIWPPETDSAHALRYPPSDLSALYVGDYDRRYLRRGIVRNSLYSRKILVLDPFVYPLKVNPKYSPLHEPDQHRVQTLRNANLFFDLLPWIDAGIVDLIRSPTDFDPSLAIKFYQKQQDKLASSPELAKLLEEQVKALSKRHEASSFRRNMMLAAPDTYLLKTFRELPASPDKPSEEDFIEFVQRERDQDIDFLEPLGDGNSGQLLIHSSGSGYEEAKLIASLTGAYVTTDLMVRWKEIEQDREQLGSPSDPWSPFSKAMSDAPLRVLNNIDLKHALQLRLDGRLESMRGFLNQVWRRASSDQPFQDANATALAAELQDEIRKAEADWEQIEIDARNLLFGGAAATLAAGASTAFSLASAGFLAAAGLTAISGVVAFNTAKRRQHASRYPAAFFLNIDDKD